MRITVRDLMMPAAAVAAEGASIAAARSTLLRWNAAEAFVVDAAGKLLGVVPDYEFLKAELSGLPSDSPVTALLSTKVETVEADADVATVLPKMREGWCGRIAVVEKGRLVGRLTRSEVLRLIVSLRQVAAVTEATTERRIVRGPHFKTTGRKLGPVKKLAGPKAAAKSTGRKVRRLAAG